MGMTIVAQPLTREGFKPFGEVLEKPGAKSFLINNGLCRRHHAMAIADVVGDNAQVGISIFEGRPYQLPHRLTLVERHPLGSQAFFPLGAKDWLVIVCLDDDGKPVKPQAFLATNNQGISLNRGVWHGVLTPLYEPSDFLVVDRIGPGDNLEEHPFELPYTVVLE